MKVMAPISVGELIDKITILEIKLGAANRPEQRVNVVHELQQLNDILSDLTLPSDVDSLRSLLKAVNQALWYIEEYKRECERQDAFGPGFVTAARQVYLKNDQRAHIKRQINDLCHSDIVEEKFH